MRSEYPSMAALLIEVPNPLGRLRHVSVTTYNSLTLDSLALTGADAGILTFLVRVFSHKGVLAFL